jgi:hypothetical protein
MMKPKAPNERRSRSSWRAGPESPRYVCAAGAGGIFGILLVVLVYWFKIAGGRGWGNGLGCEPVDYL